MTGGAGVLHTLVFSLVLMVVVMLSTVGRRPVRKLLLGLPIGTMLHLVFDGAWATTDLFWWPLGGWSFDELRAARGVPRAGSACRSSWSAWRWSCGSGAGRASATRRRGGRSCATGGCSREPP